MTIPVTFFLAIASMLFLYSIGQGGPVGGLAFFGVLFLGVLIKATEPLREKLKP